MKAFWIYILLVCIAPHAFSQDQLEIDSLQSVLKRNTNDTSKVRALNRLGEIFQQIDHKQSLNYLIQAEKTANLIKDNKGLFYALFEKGYVHLGQGDLTKALLCFKKGEAIANQLNDDYLKCRILNAKGAVYKTQSNYNEALNTFLSALKIAERINDPIIKGNLLGNIGLVFYEYNEINQALKYYYQAYKIAEQLGDNRLLGIQSNNIALVYSKQRDFVKSLEYHHKSLKYKREIGNITGIAYSLNNIGKTLIEQGKYNEAIDYLKQSLQVNNVFDKDLLSISYLNLGEAYLKINMYEEALKAEQQSLQLSKDVGTKIGVKESLEMLHQIYYAKKDFLKAYEVQNEFIAIKDTIFNEEKNKQLTQIREQYEAEKKEKELVVKQHKINLLERDNRIAFLWRNLFGMGLVLSGIVGFLIYKFQRLKADKNKELFNTQQALTMAELENSRLKSEELQKELHFINKELTTYALNMVQKNEIMEELKKNIDTIKKDSEQAVSKKLNNLNKLVDYSFNLDKDWEDFKLYFEKVHYNFFKTLKEKCPDITPNELKLCALLKLNMNLKESSTILGISAESVKTARYRLRKKLNISRETNLIDYIMAMEE